MTPKFLELRGTSVRKRMRNIVIFAPLKCKGFEVSAAAHSLVRRSSQWGDGEIIQKSFQSAPML